MKEAGSLGAIRKLSPVGTWNVEDADVGNVSVLPGLLEVPASLFVNDVSDPGYDIEAYSSDLAAATQYVHIGEFIYVRVGDPPPDVTGDVGATKISPADDYDAVGDPGGLRFRFTFAMPNDFDLAAGAFNNSRFEVRVSGQGSDDQFGIQDGTWKVIGFFGAHFDANTNPPTKSNVDLFFYPGLGANPSPENVTLEVRFWDDEYQEYSPVTTVTMKAKLAAGVDQPAEGIVFAFLDDTHQLNQTWERVDQ
jgi:hypothetical protein